MGAAAHQHGLPNTNALLLRGASEVPESIREEQLHHAAMGALLEQGWRIPSADLKDGHCQAFSCYVLLVPFFASAMGMVDWLTLFSGIAFTLERYTIWLVELLAAAFLFACLCTFLICYKTITLQSQRSVLRARLCLDCRKAVQG